MIELWLVDLRKAAPALAAVERETPRLSRDDRERAMRLLHGEEQRLRLAAYSALRVALERVAGRKARRRAYQRNCGAPSLAGVAARFNLSHTEGVALIGVAQSSAIGVDVEKLRPVRVSARRRQEILAAGSGLSQKRLSGSSKDRAFLQAWARLEAYAKAQGLALGRVLDDLGLRGAGRGALSLEAIERLARREALCRALRVVDLKLPEDLLGAVAVKRSGKLPRLRPFPVDVAGVRGLLAA